MPRKHSERKASLDRLQFHEGTSKANGRGPLESAHEMEMPAGEHRFRLSFTGKELYNLIQFLERYTEESGRKYPRIREAVLFAEMIRNRARMDGY